MFRTALISLAFVSAPAFAQAHFQAQPEARPAAQRVLARDNIWRCGESYCTSPRTTTRPAIVCSTLVREIGQLRSFSAGGQPFSAEQLAACNARARGR
jgi:hypothetical protein